MYIYISLILRTGITYRLKSLQGPFEFELLCQRVNFSFQDSVPSSSQGDDLDLVLGSGSTLFLSVSVD